MSSETEISKRDFPNVLRKVLLSEKPVEYSIADLEFEFELSWKELKPLLDKFCDYSTQNDKIVINSQRAKENREREEILTPAEVKIVTGWFFKGGRYRSIHQNKFSGDPKLLKLALRDGVVIQSGGLLMLHKYLRLRENEPTA